MHGVMKLKPYKIYFFMIYFLIIFQDTYGNDLSKHLLDFEIFLGKRFQGEFYNSSKENPLVDIIYFERILNGEAIKITHSVNHGEYGGEYIIAWNSDKGKIESYYFSTGGEIRVSSIDITNNEISIKEDFSKNKNGIQKVKKIFRLDAEGSLENNVSYMINNMWVKSHEMIYSRNDSAKIIFR